jgi:hypothetical protein
LKPLLSILFLFTTLIVLPFYVNAQRNNIWYFGGNSGLNFNNTSAAPPTPLTDGIMAANEGCSICNEEGGIMFYADGRIAVGDTLPDYSQLFDFDNGTGEKIFTTADRGADRMAALVEPSRHLPYLYGR